MTGFEAVKLTSLNHVRNTTGEIILLNKRMSELKEEIRRLDERRSCLFKAISSEKNKTGDPVVRYCIDTYKVFVGEALDSIKRINMTLNSHKDELVLMCCRDFLLVFEFLGGRIGVRNDELFIPASRAWKNEGCKFFELSDVSGVSFLAFPYFRLNCLDEVSVFHYQDNSSHLVVGGDNVDEFLKKETSFKGGVSEFFENFK